MRFAMHNWMRVEPIEATIRRLARFGYDAIEISGEPDWYDWKEVRRLLDETGLKCWGSDVNGQLGDGHVPTSNVPLSVIGFSASAPVQVPALAAPGLVLLIAALAVTAGAALSRAGSALSPRS